MGRKEERENDKAAGSGKKTGPKAGASKATPRKSGEVKGPMGVGGKETPSTKATVRKPSKVNTEGGKSVKESTAKTSARTSKQTKPEASSQEIQVKGLPEKTSHTEEHLTVIPKSGKEPRRKSRMADSGMHQKDTTPIILGESTTENSTESTPEKAGASVRKKAVKKKEVIPPLTEKIDAEAVKEKIRRAKKKEKEEKGKDILPKKMARRKVVQGISAEEKSKLPDTSITEDLKAAAQKTTEKLMDEFIPSKDTQEELKELVRSVLPLGGKSEKASKKKSNP